MGLQSKLLRGGEDGGIRDGGGLGHPPLPPYKQLAHSADFHLFTCQGTFPSLVTPCKVVHFKNPSSACPNVQSYPICHLCICFGGLWAKRAACPQAPQQCIKDCSFCNWELIGMAGQKRCWCGLEAVITKEWWRPKGFSFYVQHYQSSTYSYI